MGGISDPRRSLCTAALRIADNKRAMSPPPAVLTVVPWSVDCFTRRHGSRGGRESHQLGTIQQPNRHPMRLKKNLFPYLAHPTVCPFSVPLSVVGDGSDQTSLPFSLLRLRQAASASSLLRANILTVTNQNALLEKWKPLSARGRT